ncbi:Cytochrome P450 [Corchorus olitorius]|uniref:Cytochrome P450 n=1 Tax=Corchorus olitorius TaxID=93759 RepID=A0A1R3KWA2_9ROSI|nr:Cytochrome P450 [Corchorus olitorius]
MEDLKFGDITVPKGCNVWTLLGMVHQDPEIWGPDAYKFKPERFANGVRAACKYPYFYMPFGVGPRVCAGQHFAMTEMKILLGLIVKKFTLSLSPNYVHDPALALIIEPKNGVDILVRKV